MKERKFRAASGALVGALGLAAGLYEDAKFANDILEAWYQALPKNLKETGLRPDQKAKALYLNLRLDFIFNLYLNYSYNLNSQFDR